MALPLCRALQDIMTSSAKIISSKQLMTGSAGGSIEQNVLDLRNKLGNVHLLLDEYREHEARETLIKEMARQLEDSLALEASLQK